MPAGEDSHHPREQVTTQVLSPRMNEQPLLITLTKQVNSNAASRANTSEAERQHTVVQNASV